MPVNSANQGIPEQQGADPANLPSAQVSWDGVMENRLVQRYASIADRTARRPAPNENELSALADVDRVEVFDSANWVSQAKRGFYLYAARVTDAAAINNSTTLVSDAVMTASLVASATYHYEGEIIYDASTVADIKVATVWPGGATPGRFNAFGHDSTTATNFKSASVTASASFIVFSGNGVGTVNVIRYSGFLTTVGAGTFAIQYAQNAAEATNLTVRASSYLRMARMS
jgi:hypothetical protein